MPTPETTRRRSPIEMMIDAACGYDTRTHTAQSVTPQITLRCPSCGDTKKADLDRTDPPNTAVVECICPECDAGDKSEVSYFNAAGQQIDCDKGLPL